MALASRLVAPVLSAPPVVVVVGATVAGASAVDVGTGDGASD